MKKLLLALAMAAVVSTGAFAQLTFGISGVQYFLDDSTGISDAWESFKEGEGVYYGGFIEVIGKNVGLGFSFNFDEADIYGSQYYLGNDQVFEGISYDANLYLSYHFFGGDFILDPFLTFGIGIVALDYAEKDTIIDTYDTVYGEGWGDVLVDEDSPLYASPYWDFGLGLGVNLGPVGIFVKGVYNMNIDGFVKGEAGDLGYFYDPDGDGYGDLIEPGAEYDLEPYFTTPFKWVFGGKILL